MKNFKRTFIALKITPENELKEAIQALKTKLDTSKIKWINQEDFHLRLHFLGETSPEQIKQVDDINILKAILSGYEKTPLQKTLIRDIYFYESILQPTGFVYTPLMIEELGGK